MTKVVSDAGTGAPALDKGLDIVEALADEPAGLSQKAVAERVGRSVGEIFRMLAALERRGYVTRDHAGLYTLTLRLFELAHRSPPQRRLLLAASKVMDELSAQLGHSAHLVMVHGDRLMVVAQAMPDALIMGWSVRLGGVFDFAEAYVSARVISAFQRPDRQEEYLRIMAERDGARPAAEIRSRLARIAADGFDCAPSGIAFGVTDVSSPVLDHLGHAVAALTVPYMVGPNQSVPAAELAEAVRQASLKISQSIGYVS